MEIHPTHDPESDDQRFWHGGKSCLKCLCLLQWDYSLSVLGPVTEHGISPCKPLKGKSWTRTEDKYCGNWGVRWDV